jgi:DNA-binding XRE family transcriptional regulator
MDALINSADVLKRFGARVRRIRLERGLSQESLSELAGLDRTYVSEIERGNTQCFACQHSSSCSRTRHQYIAANRGSLNGKRPSGN